MMSIDQEPNIESISEVFRGVSVFANSEHEADIAPSMDFAPSDAIRFAQLLLREARKAERKKALSIQVWMNKDEERGDWLQVVHCWEVKRGPRFKFGESVSVSVMGGKVGTIVRIPKKRSRGFLFGGQYAYNVSFADYSTQRLVESHLSPVAAARAGQ
jgi:hypothetical protein